MRQEGYSAVFEAAGIKTAASALRKRVTMDWQPDYRGGGIIRMFLPDIEGDFPIGRVAVGRKGYILGSEIEPEYAGLGLGKKMYGELMRRMPDQELSSGTSVSPSARRVWESMQRNPDYDVHFNEKSVRENPRMQLITSGTLATLDGTPVFTGRLPPEAAIKTGSTEKTALTRAQKILRDLALEDPNKADALLQHMQSRGFTPRRFLKEIGAGGEGVTDLVADPSGIAVDKMFYPGSKFTAPHGLARKEEYWRAMGEARPDLITKLRGVSQVGTANPATVFTHDYVPGPTVAHRPDRIALRDAIAEAEQELFPHLSASDLRKPNLRYDAEGNPKVVDALVKDPREDPLVDQWWDEAHASRHPSIGKMRERRPDYGSSMKAYVHRGIDPMEVMLGPENYRKFYTHAVSARVPPSVNAKTASLSRSLPAMLPDAVWDMHPALRAALVGTGIGGAVGGATALGTDRGAEAPLLGALAGAAGGGLYRGKLRPIIASPEILPGLVKGSVPTSMSTRTMRRDYEPLFESMHPYRQHYSVDPASDWRLEDELKDAFNWENIIPKAEQTFDEYGIGWGAGLPIREPRRIRAIPRMQLPFNVRPEGLGITTFELSEPTMRRLVADEDLKQQMLEIAKERFVPGKDRYEYGGAPPLRIEDPYFSRWFAKGELAHDLASSPEQNEARRLIRRALAEGVEGIEQFHGGSAYLEGEAAQKIRDAAGLGPMATI